MSVIVWVRPVLLGALALAGCTSSPPTRCPHYDLLLAANTVYDGSRAGPTAARIGVIDGRIRTLSAPQCASADTLIRSKDYVVMPGLIDPHTHALGYLRDPARSANLNYLLQGVTTVFIGNDGRGVPDRAVTLAQLRAQGIGTNVGFYAGHGRIRRAVLGMQDRAPDAQELRAMQGLLEEALREGALGMSSGLFYAPGSYARRPEVVALARTVANWGGVYDTHIRDEGGSTFGLLEAIDEAIDIGRQSGVPVHIAHIKALGSNVWGYSARVIERVEQARREGITVTADQYPWRASGTRFSNALIPRWAMADSRAALHERLRDAALWPRLEREMQASLERRGGADAMLVTGANSPYRGKTLAAIAREMGISPLRAAIEMVLAGDPSIASFVMTDQDIHAFAVQPWVMTGSDGSSGHPRKYATYPEAWRAFVMDAKIMRAEDFVHRSSGRVADAFGLCDRGYLQVGRRADIVVVDLATYRPNATYERPTELSSGVVHAIVGGRFAVRDTRPTAVLPGEILHRQQLRCAGE